MASSPARFGLIGSGWRSQFFLRLAQQAPAHFQVTGLLTRDAQRSAEVEGQWKIPAVGSVDELLDGNPEFVIPCVPWSAMAETTIRLGEAGAGGVVEAPPAPDLDGLRALWAAIGSTGRVQVAEQYSRMPAHAARLSLLRDRVIGQVTSAQVSST